MGDPLDELKQFFLYLSDPPILVSKGLRGDIFSLLKSPFKKAVILFVEGNEPTERKVRNIREVAHLLQECFDLLTSFPEEDLHLRALEDEGSSSVEFLESKASVSLSAISMRGDRGP